MKRIELNSKEWILSTFYLLYCLLLFSRLIYDIKIGYAKDSWSITEWLINYQGGFVRRGLWGELIFQICTRTGTSPYTLIVGISLLFYVVVSGYFFRRFLKEKYPLLLLPLVFFLGGPIINQFIVRKDLLLILLFVGSLHLSQSRHRTLSLSAMNLLIIIGLLTHEAIGFFSLPVLFFILSNQEMEKGKKPFRAIVRSVLFLFPSAIVFLLVLYFKGDKETSWAIWNSWNNMHFPITVSTTTELPPRAVGAIGWSIQDAMVMPLAFLRKIEYGIYAPLAIAILVLIIFFMITHLKRVLPRFFFQGNFREFDSSLMSRVLLLQLVTFVPLGLLGWDYGRLAVQWVTSSIAVYLIIPQEQILALYPRIIEKFGHGLNRFLERILLRLGTTLIFLPLVIGFPYYSWSIATFKSSIAVYFVYSNIASLIERIL